MKASALVTLLVISCLAVLLAWTQPQDRIVAEVAGRGITVEMLTAFADEGLYYYLYPDRAEANRRALEDLVTNELKRIDLFASGLAEDTALRSGLERKVAEELVIAYAKSQYEDRYLNEEAIRAEHDDMGRVVFYREIILPKPREASPAQLDSLRATAHHIRQQLDEGAPIEELIRRYAEASVSAPDGRAEKRLTWSETLNNPRAYTLLHGSPGEIRIFESTGHLSVARVERWEKVRTPPLDGTVRKRIVAALQSRHAERATLAFKREWTVLIDTTALRWDPAALQQVVDWSNMPDFFDGNYHTIISQYLAEHHDRQILTDLQGDLRFSDLPRLFDTVLTIERSGRHGTEFIQEFLLEAVRTKRLGERARAMGLEDTIWHPHTPSPVLAQEFVWFYNQRRVEERIPETTEAALRAFYELYDDSLFYQLERVNAEIIVRPDADEIEALWEKVQQGVPFAEVSHRRLIRSFERTRDGEIVTKFNPEPPYLGAFAFGLKEGEVAGPIAYEDAEQGRLYAIVRAAGRLEERQLTFEEIPDRVAKAFVDYHHARIAAEVAADLHARYPVTIYRDVLDRSLGVSAWQ